MKALLWYYYFHSGSYSCGSSLSFCPGMCVFSENVYKSTCAKPDLCFYMCRLYERTFNLYIWHTCTPTQAHTHTLSYKKHLCPTLLTLSASLPERHIKGCVHSGALCALKCWRAATEPQILIFKPSGEKKEQQQREREMERRKAHA